MSRVYVQEIGRWKDASINLMGWVERIRSLGQVNFILLRDRTGTVQVVVDNDILKDLDLTTESVVHISGRVVEDPRAPGGFEVWCESIEQLNTAEPLPLQLNTPQLSACMDTQLNHRSLSLRHSSNQRLFRLQSALVRGFQTFLDAEGFLQVFTPKLVAGGTEGGTELFALQYFERKAFLAQSPQFYKQTLVGAGFERVYEVGHVYRAERHATARHLNEYVSLDLEMAFIENEFDIMNLETRLLRFILSQLQKDQADLVDAMGLDLPVIGDAIPHLTMNEALDILRQEYGRTDLSDDLDPEAERMLGRYAQEQWQSEFLFVTNYPLHKRPMYTMPKGDGGSASFDLLFRGQEITTGGQRIHHHQQLQAAINERGLAPESFQHYLECFRYGMPPHGGLAIGLERLTALLAGRSNVREASLFPRDRHRLAP